jgi:hypothetical protein
MMRLAALMLLPLLLAGCAPENDALAERTENRRAILATDDAGQRYAIFHSSMNCFIVQPVDSTKRAAKETEYHRINSW